MQRLPNWFVVLALQMVLLIPYKIENANEPWHGISNNMVCETSKASDQPAHTHSLIRAFACHLSIL